MSTKISEQDMHKVSKELFTEGLPLSADVYTRLPSGQFLCIGRKAESSNLSALHAIAEKNADLYVKHDDYPNVIAFNLKILEKMVGNENLNPVTKVSLIRGVTEAAISDLMDRGVYVGSFEKCKQITGYIQDTTAQIQDFTKFLEIFNKMPGDMISHGIASSVISILICEQMNITMKAAIEKVAMGALLHDIGLKEIPKEILTKPRLDWTDDEVLHYESHPLRAVEILKEMKGIPADVLSIVLEHHENALGLGFPRRIRDIKMNPLARIVAVADCFVDLIYDPRREGEQRTPEEAINHIEIGMGQPFNKPVFIALKQIMHITNLRKMSG